MYQALYRKWRPRTFDDVVGQSHITETLKRQVREDRLSHAYLFTGTRGTGKTTCAKILARAANCPHIVEGNPCNCCDICRGIESGAILEVLELDAASNNSVDQIRALQEDAIYSPASVRKRVYIIDEVHMLSMAAFNALLKILEEPPEHLMFILATTELHKVPATIKSRCQQFAFKRISPAAIAGRLSYVAEQEGIALTEQGAELLARLADGGMRDALSLLDQCTAVGGELGEREILDVLGMAGNLETADLMGEIAAHDTGAALEHLDRLYAAGKDVGTLLKELATLARDLLIRKTAPKGGAGLMTGGFDEGVLRKLSAELEAPRLSQILGRLQAVTAALGTSTNRRVDAELCLIRLCDESLDDSPAGLNARLSRLEEMAASGSLTAPAPAALARTAPAAPERSAPPTRSAAAEELPPWDMEPPPIRKAPASQTRRAEAVPAPAPVEEMPPWDMEPPPVREAPPPAAPRRVAPRQAARPAEPQQVRPAPAPAAREAAAPVGDFWPGLVAGLRGKIPMGEFSFISNPTMAKGFLDGKLLKIWVQNDLVKAMLSKPGILPAVEQAASILPGAPYRAQLVTGELPRPVSGGSVSAQKADQIDDLVAKSRQFDNIIIED